MLGFYPPTHKPVKFESLALQIIQSIMGWPWSFKSADVENRTEENQGKAQLNKFD